MGIMVEATQLSLQTITAAMLAAICDKMGVTPEQIDAKMSEQVELIKKLKERIEKMNSEKPPTPTYKWDYNDLGEIYRKEVK